MGVLSAAEGVPGAGEMGVEGEDLLIGGGGIGEVAGFLEEVADFAE